MKLNCFSVVIFALMVMPVGLHACTTIGTIADGRVSAPVFVTNPTDVTFSFVTTPGHSYCGEVALVQEDYLSSLDLEININTSSCQTTDMTGPTGALDTTNQDPAFGSGRRVSFLAALSAYFMNVHNFGVSGHW